MRHEKGRDLISQSIEISGKNLIFGKALTNDRPSKVQKDAKDISGLIF